MAEEVAKYGLLFPYGSSDYTIEKTMIRSGGYIDGFGEGLFSHYRRFQTILWGDRCEHHEWSDLILKTLLEERYTLIQGSRDCLSGDTPLFDPTTGRSPTIKALVDSNRKPTVMTLMGPMAGSVPFLRGTAQLLEIRLSDGSRFRASAGHLILTARGYVRPRLARHAGRAGAHLCLRRVLQTPAG